jgi:hypothetical protein
MVPLNGGPDVAKVAAMLSGSLSVNVPRSTRGISSLVLEEVLWFRASRDTAGVVRMGRTEISSSIGHRRDHFFLRHFVNSFQYTDRLRSNKFVEFFPPIPSIIRIQIRSKSFQCDVRSIQLSCKQHETAVRTRGVNREFLRRTECNAADRPTEGSWKISRDLFYTP